MKPQLYTVTIGDHRTQVLAENIPQALDWLVDNTPHALQFAQELTIRRDADVVDLTKGGAERAQKPAARRSAPRRAIPPPAPNKRAKATKPPKSGEVPEGMILVSDLAKEAGITAVGMKRRLVRAGVTVKRIEGQGRPAACNEAKGRAAMHGEAKPKKERAARPKAEKTSKSGEVPVGMILVSELARQAGITTEGMRHRLNKAKVKLHRMDGKGRPMIVDEADARAKLEVRAKNPSKHAPKRDPRSGHSKPPEAELRKLSKVAQGSPEPAAPAPDKFRRIDDVAKALRMDEAEVAAIKKRGNVSGGFGWVNLTQLEAYMASPEYKQNPE